MAVDQGADDPAVDGALERLVLRPRQELRDDGPVVGLEAADPKPVLVCRPAPEAAPCRRKPFLERELLHAVESMVPGEGIEPSWGCPQSILSRSRLPFRHPGAGAILPAAKREPRRSGCRLPRDRC